MSDLEKVVATIPLGITPEGLKVLKDNKYAALKLIDECIKGCQNSISEVSKRTDGVIYLPYLNSCKKELDRIRDILFTN